MCWLKREVVPRAKASCCVSGVRGAGVIEPALGDVEYSIDRVGGDYRSFDTAVDPRGKACAAACKADSRIAAEAGGVGLLPTTDLVGRVDALVGSWDLAVRHQPIWTWPAGLRLSRFFTTVQ